MSVVESGVLRSWWMEGWTRDWLLKERSGHCITVGRVWWLPAPLRCAEYRRDEGGRKDNLEEEQEGRGVNRGLGGLMPVSRGSSERALGGGQRQTGACAGLSRQNP